MMRVTPTAHGKQLLELGSTVDQVVHDHAQEGTTRPLVHELRNSLQTAALALTALEAGKLAMSGATRGAFMRMGRI